MKKIVILLIFFWLFSESIFGSEIDSHEQTYVKTPETKLESNPDGPIGNIIITCLGGIHTGSGDIKYAGRERQNINDLSGYLFSFKMEVPTSKSSTFLLLFNYDKQKTIGGGIENFEYDITILGGFKFFIEP